MSAQSTPRHIEITETLVRLYVFLAQYLDRCVNESARQTLPEAELQKHLSETKASMMKILSVNPVVQAKVERECGHVLDLGAARLRGKATAGGSGDDVQVQRAVLQNKTIALSDLLAVFRACEP